MLGSVAIYLNAPGESLETLNSIPPWKFVLALLLFIPMHELCHALAHPRFGFSDQTHFGWALKKGYAFCVFDGASTKIRTVIILALPFLLLTVVPIVLAYEGVRMQFWMAVTFLNAAGVGGDIVAIWFVLTRVPRGAKIGCHLGTTMFSQN